MVHTTLTKYSKQLYKLAYPNNLIDKLFGTDCHKTCPATDDRCAAIEYIISTELNQQEQSVIYLRFKDHKTLPECAVIQNCTGERIRQIETKALYKLRKPINKTAIELGLNAFYEQDIGELYEKRQNMLNQTLQDYIAQIQTDSSQTLAALNTCKITTVGDLLDYNLVELREIFDRKIASTAIRLQADCRKTLTDYNELILVLEQYRGLCKSSNIHYPINLFNRLFGYDMTYHTCSIPTRNQLDGLNQLLDQILTPLQKTILQYRYEQNISIAQCAKQLHMKKHEIIQSVRNSIHILRQKPGCDMYIYGTQVKSPPSKTTRAFVKTIAYLSDINILVNDQHAYLHSIRIDTLPLSVHEITKLRADNILTAYDALRSSSISSETIDKIRITVCLRATTVHMIPLSTRAHNALCRAGIKSAETIANMSDDELLSLNCLGIGTLSNIRNAMDTILDKLQ